MTCARCETPLRARQLKFCSRACGFYNTEPVTRNAMLALLRQTTDQWLTISDMAFWIYGSDDRSDRDAIRTAIGYLRQGGYRLDSRPAPWATFGKGRRLAYRLVEQAAEVAA